jgi:hypothetical protein|tara:strand:+ start:392 stop:526 length:135 start_codon:yes stop_codon:yes gene_type:complete
MKLSKKDLQLAIDRTKQAIDDATINLSINELVLEKFEDEMKSME